MHVLLETRFEIFKHYIFDVFVVLFVNYMYYVSDVLFSNSSHHHQIVAFYILNKYSIQRCPSELRELISYVM